MMRNLYQLTVFLGLGSMAASCASAGPVPTERLASSQAAIRAASEVGAGSVPDASLYLRFAQEEQEQGKNFVSAGENDKAAAAFRRASADAELALALAREANAKNEAKTAAAALQSGTNPVK
jgi:Domain of unknown function (DUF4398)